jgi:tripartite motif-containing protein 71
MHKDLIRSSPFMVMIIIIMLTAGTLMVPLPSIKAWAANDDPTQGMRITTGSPETCTSNCIIKDESAGSELPPHSQVSALSQQYDFVRKWGSFGTDDGQFENVAGIAINSDDKVYTSNYNGDPNPGSHHRIQEFTTLGGFITKWGTAGSRHGEFINPFGIAFDSQHNVYVADQVNQRIQKFTSNGQFITQWASGFNPTGIAIDSSDNVFVTEQFDHRVAKFTTNGMLISRWGSPGTNNGQFEYPRGIAIDSAGNVYVSDLIPNTLSYRVQKFTNDGVFLTSWGSLGSGSSPSQFNGYGIAIDPSNNVYVADSFEDKVQKFTNTGALLAEFGSTGTADGQFSTPHDVALDSSGNVYVADTFNHRIQVFAQHTNTPPNTTITSGISIPTNTTQQTDCETGGAHSAISRSCNNNSTNTVANSGGFKGSP